MMTEIQFLQFLCVTYRGDPEQQAAVMGSQYNFWIDQYKLILSGHRGAKLHDTSCNAVIHFKLGV